MNPSGVPQEKTVAFAAGPARDSRFDVKERWADCLNLPPTHPERDLEFFHRQMNEEINGLENAARSLADFPQADWGVRMSIARQAADEARHVLMFRRILEKRGGWLGRYPVLSREVIDSNMFSGLHELGGVTYKTVAGDYHSLVVAVE